MVHYNSRNDWGLIELLDKDIRDSITVICGDIRDPFFCREAVSESVAGDAPGGLDRYSLFIHCSREYVVTNVAGTLNILQDAGILGSKK